MISNRPMVPMLTHVDNLGDINLDMTTQEQSLQQIADNTETMKSNTTYLQTSVGLPADASTANTVIGLLKSISNKL